MRGRHYKGETKDGVPFGEGVMEDYDTIYMGTFKSSNRHGQIWETTAGRMKMIQ